MKNEEVELEAKTAVQARNEIKSKYPQGADYTGYAADGKAVIMSTVRPRGNKAYVATASIPGKKAVRFACVPNPPAERTRSKFHMKVEIECPQCGHKFEQ